MSSNAFGTFKAVVADVKSKYLSGATPLQLYKTLSLHVQSCSESNKSPDLVTLSKRNKNHPHFPLQ